MNRYLLLIPALLATFIFTACDSKPTVINVPAGPAGAKGEPGNEGAQGDTGAKGKTGTKGETGTAGENTTVIIAPPTEQTPAIGSGN